MICSLLVVLFVIGLVEYVFHLCRLYPDMLYIDRDTGTLHTAYYKLGVDDSKGRVSRHALHR